MYVYGFPIASNYNFNIYVSFIANFFGNIVYSLYTEHDTQ